MWKGRENRVDTRGEVKGRSGIPHPELIFPSLAVENVDCTREWEFLEATRKSKTLRFPVTALLVDMYLV